jgi:hypothetical protein
MHVDYNAETFGNVVFCFYISETYLLQKKKREREREKETDIVEWVENDIDGSGVSLILRY